MKSTDLLIICPAKFGGWMMKNPTLMAIDHTQNGVTRVLVANSGGCSEVLYVKDADAALVKFAELVAIENGCISLDTSSMRDLIVPRAAYFGREDDDNDGT